MKPHGITRTSTAPSGTAKALLHLLAISTLTGAMALPSPAAAVHRSFAPTARNFTGFAFYGDYGTFFADVTGDGKADAIAVNSDRIWFRRSDGCSFGPNEMLTSTPFFGTRATYFADVTGDGKADPIAVNQTNTVVRRSEDARRLTWTSDAIYGDIDTAFADVNGDGRADAIAVHPAGVAIRRSNGSTGFGFVEYWTSEAYYGTRGTYFADVTGDAKADAIVVNDWGVTVRRANAASNGFNINETWTPDAYYGNQMNTFADATGDRRADAIVVNDDGVAIRDSLGYAFRSPTPPNNVVSSGDAVIRAWGYWTRDPFYGSRGTYFADVDGDRAVDAIAVNDDGVWIRRALFVDFFANCPDDQP